MSTEPEETIPALDVENVKPLDPEVQEALEESWEENKEGYIYLKDHD